MTLSESRFASCGTGIVVDQGGAMSITDTTFEACTQGLQVGTVAVPRSGDQSPFVDVTGSQFIDDTVGISMNGGTLSFTDSAITGGDASQSGIVVTSGTLTASDVAITGQAVSGVVAAMSNNDLFGVLDLTGLLIEGGQYGVLVRGAADGGSLRLTSSTVRDQTTAAVSFAIYSWVNHAITDSQLSVLSGFALEDVRIVPNTSTTFVTSTTLNGNTYTGEVQGPIAVPPDYRITNNQTIQFSP